MSRRPEYYSWWAIHQRCLNPSHVQFSDYGGRGITICDRWLKSFENFLMDMGPKPSPSHSIERIDNSGNYEPENCRWADPFEQAHNKRNNHKLTLGSQTLTLTEWSRITGLNGPTILRRLNLGWSEEEALTIPLRVKKQPRYT